MISLGKDLTGRRFGRLTAIEPYQRISNGKVKWLCHCDCGESAVVLNYNLLNGHTLSCGCLQRERAKEHATSHGMSDDRLYRTWAHMKERCSNPNVRNYVDYGGRGITVCEEWKTYEPFAEWALSHGYTDSLTIERIDNEEGYSPDNCRLATPLEQASNKRSNHTFTIDGVTDTMTNWARKYGIKPTIVFDRLFDGWSEYEALTIPKGGRRCKGSESQRAC